MRLWTLHPKYLDRVGLLALWREALLAQAVLRGKTRGYRNHPQLIRFRNYPEPPAAIGAYLTGILGEALWRGYHFNPAKIGPCRDVPAIPVTRGQLLYERDHLLGKLAVRDCAACRVLTRIDEPDPHPLFTICEGEVETWERI
ncbi:MAG: pyrimidine dimer DNA glycosylase/endonuclease V [Deltaproteobacteria bacterium]|nr:pyrimidine dimer DNA glycosylase/endonuclease V [Deltaproteobacteria bacterium]